MIRSVEVFNEEDFLPKKKNRVKRNVQFIIQRKKRVVAKSDVAKLVE